MIVIDERIKKYEGLVKDLRRELHKIPETGFDVYKTRTLVIDHLNKNNIEVIDGYGKTAVLGLIKGKNQNETIAFRADMDALNVTEETNRDFKSIHQGHMHACGHDGHMAALLGFASYLNEVKEHLEKNILLVFQPAEEGPGGAEVIVNENVFEKYNVKEIYGMHLYPNVEEGKIAVKAGPLMAQNGEFDIIIEGKSAHGAQPHNGVDAIVAAAEYITNVQSILPRFINPIEPGVVTIGKITGGERCNVIPKHVLLEGTIRTFSAEVYNTIKDKLNDFAKSIEIGHGCKVQPVFRDMYPAVNNDEHLYNDFIEAVGVDNTEKIDPQMLSEDFAFYQTRVPGIFFFMGTRNEKKGFVHSLHHASFDFDEKVLVDVIQTYVNVLRHKNIIKA